MNEILIVPFDAEIVSANEFRLNLSEFSEKTADGPIIYLDGSYGIVSGHQWIRGEDVGRRGVVVSSKEVDTYLMSGGNPVKARMWNYLFCSSGRPPQWVSVLVLKCLGTISRVGA